MKLSRELKVGLLSVVTIGMLYFGFNFLKGSDIFSPNKKYFVIYNNIDGLTSSNPIMLNGLVVGQVRKIVIEQDKNNRLLVTLDIRKDLVFRKGTQAILADGGLLGDKVIRLKISPTGNELQPGDTLIGNQEAGIQALLQERTLPVITHADSLVQNLNTVTKGFQETGAILNQVLRNFDQTGSAFRATLQQNQKSLAELTANLSKLSGSLIETEKKIGPLLTKTGTFADSLNALRLGETVNRANQLVGQMEQLVAAVKTGQGTASKLINDDKLYNNLNYTIISMNQLLANLRENPKRYVNVSIFGKKDKGPTESPVDTTLEFKQPMVDSLQN
ncbi:MlaD family protein [Persicitalea jodogahamensis]|uniref:Organic solvent ABC transporter substrate-binding protein n=1 Tax=Persicitalea jodogahamensis TaxID=402147 RepID=A0A8J3D1X1_9BACT|nr:MlaD family protein [Persicitalea jodogahamensis]GHB55387.1 organic solvent ABC transporter substrate-binding protein [Persicitalea jodogahamensis]